MNLIKWMNRPFFWVIALSGALFAGTFFLPDRTANDPIENLPWKSEILASGQHKALGIVLGQTSLAQAMRQYGSEVKIGVILESDGKQSLEAYFDHIRIAGLSAGMIVTLDASAEELVAMQKNASAEEGTETGNLMFLLNPADKQASLNRAIRTITYLPKVDLPEEVIEKRFGMPERKEVTANNSDLTLWDYPKKKLRIWVDTQQRDIIEYY
jgi:hypothetical protein